MNRKVLQVAGELANNINQPLSVMIAALDTIKDKCNELPEAQRNDFLETLKVVNKQADAMIEMAENLKKLALDPRKHYILEKK